MMNLYAVRDAKADSFGAPMSIRTEGLATRSFVEAVMAPNSELGKYAADYALYHVGTYDPNSGTLTGLTPAPRFVMSAVNAMELARKERLEKEPTLPGVEVK